jgi:hypothetical protein
VDSLESYGIKHVVLFENVLALQGNDVQDDLVEAAFEAVEIHCRAVVNKFLKLLGVESQVKMFRREDFRQDIDP